MNAITTRPRKNLGWLSLKIRTTSPKCHTDLKKQLEEAQIYSFNQRLRFLTLPQKVNVCLHNWGNIHGHRKIVLGFEWDNRYALKQWFLTLCRKLPSKFFWNLESSISITKRYRFFFVQLTNYQKMRNYPRPNRTRTILRSTAFKKNFPKLSRNIVTIYIKPNYFRVKADWFI